MSEWETVTLLRKKPQKASAMKTEQVSSLQEPHTRLSVRASDPSVSSQLENAVNRARRDGVPVETQHKWGAGQNKQHISSKNTAKLDRETEELRHETIPLGLGKLIQQTRQARGMSQKDLATKINEKPQVINDYEAGRGIPNQAIIGKMERVLGVKLRGKEQGTTMMPPGKK